MKIYVRKNDELFAGIPAAIPGEFYTFLTPAATTNYYEYPFGYFLNQEIENEYYKYNICRLIIHEPASIQVTNTPGIFLLASLGEDKATVLDYLPAKDHFKMQYLGEESDHEINYPCTTEWFQFQWKTENLIDLPEVAPDYLYLFEVMGIGDIEDLGAIQVKMTFFMNYLVNQMRYPIERSTVALLDNSMNVKQLIIEYADAYNRLQLVTENPKDALLIKIADEIMECPNINRAGEYYMHKYKMNGYDLISGFNRLFGKTPEAYVKEACMTYVSYVTNRNDWEMEQLAKQFGYEGAEALSEAYRVYLEENDKDIN